MDDKYGRDPRLREFRNFVFFLWKALRLPHPTEVQYDIALYLSRGPRRRMVKAFRGVGKSWLTAAYVLWRLYWDPDERILVVSASKDRADAFSTFVRRLIDDVEWLHFLRPNPQQGQRDSVVAFDVGPSSPHQAPSMRSVGITGQMTGGRATIIVADDIETPKNSLTLLMRERLAELIKEFDAILVPDKEDTEIIYLGTPQCEESVYNTLPDRGYDVRVWPAVRPTPDWMQHYAHELTQWMRARIEGLDVGEPTDPQRFSAKDLQERRLSYGASGFALQFQLDTRLSDANKYPLRLNDLVVLAVGSMAPLKVVWGGGTEHVAQDLPSVGLKGDRLRRPAFVHKDYVEFDGTVMFIDPSGRGEDETAYAVVRVSHGIMYLVACGGYTDGYTDEVMTALAKVARRYTVNQVLVEPNFGDGMFLKLFQPHLAKLHPCALEEAPRATIQKERRIIDTLEPVMNQHRLVICEDVIRQDLLAEDPARQLCYQMTRITRERGALRKDDRIDAVAGAVRYWVDNMAQDVDDMVESAKNEAIERELERFMEHALGAPVRSGGLVDRYALG